MGKCAKKSNKCHQTKVAAHCAVTCGATLPAACDEQSTPTPAPTPNTPAPSPAPGLVCEDLWSRGKCEGNKRKCDDDYVGRNCAGTCGVCARPICEDLWSESKCAKKKSKCHQTKVGANCAATCGALPDVCPVAQAFAASSTEEHADAQPWLLPALYLAIAGLVGVSVLLVGVLARLLARERDVSARVTRRLICAEAGEWD